MQNLAGWNRVRLAEYDTLTERLRVQLRASNCPRRRKLLLAIITARDERAEGIRRALEWREGLQREFGLRAASRSAP